MKLISQAFDVFRREFLWTRSEIDHPYPLPLKIPRLRVESYITDPVYRPGLP